MRSKNKTSQITRESLVPELESLEIELAAMLDQTRQDGAAALDAAKAASTAKIAEAEQAIAGEIDKERNEQFERIRSEVADFAKAEAGDLEKFAESAGKNLPRAAELLVTRVLMEESE